MKPLSVSQEIINTAVEQHLKALSLINNNEVVESVAFAGREEFYVYLTDEFSVYLKKD